MPLPPDIEALVDVDLGRLSGVLHRPFSLDPSGDGELLIFLKCRLVN